MMKTGKYKLGCAICCLVAISLVPLVAQETEMKPKYYDEIKAILQRRTNDAGNLLNSKSDEVVPALILLFKETINHLSLTAAEYRAAAVNVLNHEYKKKKAPEEAWKTATMFFSNDRYCDWIIVTLDRIKISQESKKMVADFLAKQLESEVDQWKGVMWIESVIKFLTKVDPEKARVVSRKALNFPEDGFSKTRHEHLYADIKRAAIYSLRDIETMEDIEHLEAFVLQRKKINEKDGLASDADKAIQKITERASSEK